ncbi:type II toxin-antitoxin system prevent-host-death family antitoxin [Paracoccus sp. DMF-8]|uniref:type II toxin-antitoxin system Phd/YefM family antitoxin n=1 Tax=Paracoccus sp. DMF-8 TaxID=3019445 RepID=UPI0023E7B475|nr:type II toxin-antitoxin system prevent-host-death family antitoxin [Paracoccus sp. DMF-8]MDF3604711.1 type II toxin-antitoxin system prevent-host-death family antitoxin [Paracoccus sp. DMF-8]
MKTVNMHEAKTHLSRLIEEAEKGQPFIIARAGKPAVQVTAIDVAPPRRLGFLQDQFAVPTAWDRNIPLPGHKADS